MINCLFDIGLIVLFYTILFIGLAFPFNVIAIAFVTVVGLIIAYNSCSKMVATNFIDSIKNQV